MTRSSSIISKKDIKGHVSCQEELIRGFIFRSNCLNTLSNLDPKSVTQSC